MAASPYSASLAFNYQQLGDAGNATLSISGDVYHEQEVLQLTSSMPSRTSAFANNQCVSSTSSSLGTGSSQSNTTCEVIISPAAAH
ncbi:hypothetical protein JHK85_021090 [Glycine max]|nr:hypothetical protein JHK85_021090 [Glycine max]